MEHNDVLCPYCGKKMRLSTLCSVGYEHSWYQYICEWCRATSPAEDTREEAYKAAHRRFEAAQPKWISVEERLPEPDKNVLTLKNRKRVRIGYYSEDCEEWVINDMIAYDEDITHWMPLPTVPEVNT